MDEDKRQSVPEPVHAFSLSDDLGNSWPNRRKLYRRRKGGEAQAAAAASRNKRRLQRPRTAVLKRPAVLDESLKVGRYICNHNSGH